MKKCTLDATLHNCPYLEPTSTICNNSDKCSFQEKTGTRELPRKEKWYEPYYQKRRFI